MLVNKRKIYTPQDVSSFLDVQDRISIWVNRAGQYSGYKESSSSGSQVVITRKPKAYYQQALIGLIIGFFYGMFMYGLLAGLFIAGIFAACYACYIPFLKPTKIVATIEPDPPFKVTVDADGNKQDFNKILDDLNYILSTAPDSTLT